MGRLVRSLARAAAADPRRGCPCSPSPVWHPRTRPVDRARLGFVALGSSRPPRLLVLAGARARSRHPWLTVSPWWIALLPLGPRSSVVPALLHPSRAWRCSPHGAVIADVLRGGLAAPARDDHRDASRLRCWPPSDLARHRPLAAIACCPPRGCGGICTVSSGVAGSRVLPWPEGLASAPLLLGLLDRGGSARRRGTARLGF